MTPSTPRLTRALLRGSALVLAGVAALALPILVLVIPKRRTTLIWGVEPIINLKYWSQAMREAGWDSRTLVATVYTTINTRADFDLVFEDLVPRFFGPLLRRAFGPYVAFLYVIRHAAVLHVSFRGGPLGETAIWRLEAPLLRWAGVRVVVLPYGSDAFVYSRVRDPSVRNGLLRSYPEHGRREDRVDCRVRYWSRHASVIVVGFTLDGLPRWDVPVGNFVAVDTDEWVRRSHPSSADGRRGVVRVLHAPNHRGAKGTEFIVHAVEQLRQAGLAVELVLAERVQNSEVRALMQQVDILADQLLLPGYGLAAIEGMASGLPVIANLDHPADTALFDRYSFLGECPVISATPETVESVLRTLVVDPELRLALGAAARAYVEKYHSFEAARYLFGAVYECVLRKADVELATLFHPLSSPFNRRLPRVSHPLVDHHLPPARMARAERAGEPSTLRSASES